MTNLLAEVGDRLLNAKHVHRLGIAHDRRDQTLLDGDSDADVDVVDAEKEDERSDRGADKDVGDVGDEAEADERGVLIPVVVPVAALALALARSSFSFSGTPLMASCTAAAEGCAPPLALALTPALALAPFVAAETPSADPCPVEEEEAEAKNELTSGAVQA